MYSETLYWIGAGMAMLVIVTGYVCYNIGKARGVAQFCKKYFNVNRIELEPSGLTLWFKMRGASVFFIHAHDSREARHKRAVMNAQNLLEAVQVG